jgi:peptide/nickel transport system substrate-binding protein
VNRRKVAAVGLSALLALALAAACSKASNTTNNNTAGNTTAKFNAANGQIFKPSTTKGGTLHFGLAGDFDSVDPGNTYYGFSWNFLRLYGRALTMFKPAPGKASQQLVGDLAEGLGVPSDGGKTWTYHLRAGLKYEDGTPIVSQDVKYAVERAFDKDVLVNGPTYMSDHLDRQGYTGPYKMPNAVDPAITTPDDRTIVFHLKAPFSSFDYFAMLPETVPVPKAKDTGKDYQQHVVASGPYKFQTYEPGKSMVLVRNDQWSAATDPNRSALPDEIDVTLGMNGDDLDKQIQAGTIDADLAGTGVGSAMQTQLLAGGDAAKAQADNPTLARLWYTSINPHVKPFDNVNCRIAVEFAADKAGYQAGFGGPVAGGDIATGMIPPVIPGFQKFDLYPAGSDNTGDLDKAKAALAACGKPNGFDATIAYRSERSHEKAVAESLQQSLKRVGINLTIKGFPAGKYFSDFAGNQAYRDSNNLGLLENGWGADWNTGFGYLSQIVDSRTIRPSGGDYNFSIYDPTVDSLIDQTLVEPDISKVNALWGQIDQEVMKNAYVLPGVWAHALDLRSKNATNIFVDEAFGQYDYLQMGAK